MGHFHLHVQLIQHIHSPVHLQWIGIFGMSTEPRHVIAMGPRQQEAHGEATVCSAS